MLGGAGTSCGSSPPYAITSLLYHEDLNATAPRLGRAAFFFLWESLTEGRGRSWWVYGLRSNKYIVKVIFCHQQVFFRSGQNIPAQPLFEV